MSQKTTKADDLVLRAHMVHLATVCQWIFEDPTEVVRAAGAFPEADKRVFRVHKWGLNERKGVLGFDPEELLIGVETKALSVEIMVTTVERTDELFVSNGTRLSRWGVRLNPGRVVVSQSVEPSIGGGRSFDGTGIDEMKKAAIVPASGIPPLGRLSRAGVGQKEAGDRRQGEQSTKPSHGRILLRKNQSLENPHFSRGGYGVKAWHASACHDGPCRRIQRKSATPTTL